ncbi:hypothetical protein S83_047764, partial [Arachis hypogaea]
NIKKNGNGVFPKNGKGTIPNKLQNVLKVICAICDTEQPIRKQQFHCDDCRICRVGGQENYFHCEKCGSSTARSVGLAIQLHYVTIIVWRTSWACALLMLLLLDMFETIDIENFYI